MNRLGLKNPDKAPFYVADSQSMQRIVDVKTAVLRLNALLDWMNSSKINLVSIDPFFLQAESTYDASHYAHDGVWLEQVEDFEHLDGWVGTEFEIVELAPTELLHSPDLDPSNRFLTLDALGYQVSVHVSEDGINLIWEKQGEPTYEVYL